MIRWKDSIQWKVVGALIFIALLATIAAMLSSMALTRTFFTRYLDRNRYGRSEQLAEILAGYYARVGSWQDVEELLLRWSGPMGRMGPARRMVRERLVLADERGVVIVDSTGRSLGESMPKAQLMQGADVIVDGRRRGTVFLLTGAGTALGKIEEEFLSSLRRSAWTWGRGDSGCGTSRTDSFQTPRRPAGDLSAGDPSFGGRSCLPGPRERRTRSGS